MTERTGAWASRIHRRADVTSPILEAELPLVLNAVRAVEAPTRQAEPEVRERTKPEPQYNVVLIDDDEHTYEYVVRMLQTLFGHSLEDSYAMACEVDATGRVIVDTTHRERAELKRDQIKSFGADPLLFGSQRSMHAVVEPLTS